MCNQNQAIAILGEVYTMCNPILNNSIKEAYLYGSYARGDYQHDSDIDILLAVDMDANDISLVRSSISHVTSRLSLSHDITVSVAIEPLNQFVRYANILPYYKNVIKEGIRYVC